MKRRWQGFSRLVRLIFARPQVENLEERSAPTDLVLATLGTLAVAENSLRAEPHSVIAPDRQIATNSPPHKILIIALCPPLRP